MPIVAPVIKKEESSSGSQNVWQEIFDTPTQRLVVVTLFVVYEAYKVGRLLEGSGVVAPVVVWCLCDALLIWILAKLKIPMLRLGTLRSAAAWGLLAATNVAIAWRWGLLVAGSTLVQYLNRELASGGQGGEGSLASHVSRQDIQGGDEHLLGKHTVQLLATATAHLIPPLICACVAGPGSNVQVPMIVNGTHPKEVSYSVIPVDGGPIISQRQTFNAKKVEKSEKNNEAAAQRKAEKARMEEQFIEEWLGNSRKKNTDKQKEKLVASDESPPSGIFYLNIGVPGFVRLEQVIGAENQNVRILASDFQQSQNHVAKRNIATALMEAELLLRRRGVLFPAAVPVFPCPVAGFQPAQVTDKCIAGDSGPKYNALEAKVPTGLVAKGVGQLDIQWHTEAPDGSVMRFKNSVLSTNEIVDVNAYLTSDRLVGLHTVVVDAISDACGNQVLYSDDPQLLTTTTYVGSTPIASSSSSSFAVPVDVARSVQKDLALRPTHLVHMHGRVSAALVASSQMHQQGSCVLEIKDDKNSKASFVVAPSWPAGRDSDDTWDFDLRYSSNVGYPKALDKTRNATISKSRLSPDKNFELTVTDAGTYELVSAKSSHCAGTVTTANTCTVVRLPRPTLSGQWTPLLDSCSTEIGVTYQLQLTGSAPFYLLYQVENVKSRQVVAKKQKLIKGSVDTLQFDHRGPGVWKYTLLSLRDANYEVALDGVTFQQEIGASVDARWIALSGRSGPIEITSCDEHQNTELTVPVSVELSGVGPWSYELIVAGQRPLIISNVTSPQNTANVLVPATIAMRGGEFTIYLSQVRDGNGCSRTLNLAQDVKVTHTHPTARFVPLDGNHRASAIRENERALIPMQLTGMGPWSVELRGPNDETFSVRRERSNSQIPVTDAGLYTLVSVADGYCSGSVDGDWLVSVSRRPQALFSVGSKSIDNLCVGGTYSSSDDDILSLDTSLPLHIVGSPPFRVQYKVSSRSQRTSEVFTLDTSLSNVSIPLVKDRPDTYTYSITSVSDASYSEADFNPKASLVAGHSEFVHVVYPRPTAAFVHGHRSLNLCANDRVAKRSELAVKFTGTPPFSLDIAILDDSSGAIVFTQTTVSDSSSFVPDITFEPFPGSYTVIIRRVVDAHSCLADLANDLKPSDLGRRASISASDDNRPTKPRFWPFSRGISAETESTSLTSTIRAGEPAALVSVLPQNDFCVGQTLDFAVQGMPPVSLSYTFDDGKSIIEKTAHVDSPTFSFPCTTPGTLSFGTIGYGLEQSCFSNLTLQKHIHKIPSVAVSQGKSVVERLSEGQRASIIFTFDGTPPFSFTYQRVDAYGQLAHTQTVSGIMESSYTITTSLEGVWSAIWIADKFCSYPNN